MASHDEAVTASDKDLEKGTTPNLSSEKGTNSDIEDVSQDLRAASIEEEKEEPLQQTKSRSSSRPSLSKLRSRASSRKSKKDADIVREIYPETDLDKGLVGWDGQDDPLHPRNYPDRRKWMVLGFVSGITFLSPLSSSVVAPGISFMDADFHNTSSILSTFTVSIFIFGFAIGPLVLSPLSEIYGRLIVMNIANACLTIWQLGCALSPNIGAVIAFRFLGGLGGSACLAIGGGVIADLFPIQQRGLANAMFVVGPLFGPVIGPIIGGFIAQRAGWRWVYWVLLMACGSLSVGFFLVGKETNASVLIRRKTNKLIKETGRTDLKSAYDANKSPQELKVIPVLATGIARPFRMIFSSPILPLLALYVSFAFGLVYLIFTTVTGLFIKQYGWSPELCGLSYLGVGLGFMSGMVVVAKTSDPTVIRLTKAAGGKYAPEMRLATCLYFALFIPISFFWYGWSAEKKAHWIVPILGLLPFGFGTMGIFAAIQTYFIDAAGVYAASAMAGLTFFRCLFAAFLPLAAPKMYATLGLGWGNSLLGFVALGLIPVPAIIYRVGGRIREKYPIKIT